MKGLVKLALLLVLLVVGAAALVWQLNVRDETAIDDNDAVQPSTMASNAASKASPELLARGAYLARAGNCMGCHTARGGAAYAGGRAIPTPFGMVYTSNITPDVASGIGSWSPLHFWRALHNGRSKDGRLLYPAFPYTSYTQVTREDSDALFAFLASQRAMAQPNQAHTLRFPYQSQAALALWRALYFSPGVYQPDASHSAEWNRGAYLVQGLGHCSACHSARNVLGATEEAPGLAGGLIPMQNWYAPSLASARQGGVGDWDREQIVSLLKNGISPRAAVNGPMAEVVLRSTQYLSDQDLGAMAQFLKELPKVNAKPEPEPAPVRSELSSAAATAAGRGAKLYEQHCEQCHGDKGQGVAKAYPALAGNRAVTMPSTVNLVQTVLNGGFAPATAGNPRPFGMPPFVLVLDDTEVAALLTHIRNAWGNQASAVLPLDVNRIRANQSR
jgi:mono/diheme cytochrome c family protein